MTPVLPLHVAAGLIGITSGAVALWAPKGAELHRQSGRVFVYSMLFMSASGAVMAALKPSRLSVIAGLLTFYLVSTSLLTVRRPAAQYRWISVAAMLMGLTIGLLSLSFGFQGLDSATGNLDGIPAPLGFVFGSVALLAVLGDLRMLARGIAGAHRIARHLWRMCFALFIAAASFFLGQPRVFPKALFNSGLLAIPVILVLVLMFFWLGRVLLTQRYRGFRLEKS